MDKLESGDDRCAPLIVENLHPVLHKYRLFSMQIKTVFFGVLSTLPNTFQQTRIWKIIVKENKHKLPMWRTHLFFMGYMRSPCLHTSLVNNRFYSHYFNVMFFQHFIRHVHLYMSTVKYSVYMNVKSSCFGNDACGTIQKPIITSGFVQQKLQFDKYLNQPLSVLMQTGFVRTVVFFPELIFCTK